MNVAAGTVEVAPMMEKKLTAKVKHTFCDRYSLNLLILAFERIKVSLIFRSTINPFCGDTG